MDLKGAAGGGGGGGGSSGFFGDDPMMLSWFNGGRGGAGGRGENAAGTAAISQWSDVNLSATLQVNPAINPTPTDPIDGAIMLTIGWVSAANPDWQDANVWQRAINMTITAGNSTVVVTGGGGTLAIAALDDNNSPYFKVCPDNFDGDTGSFGLGMGEIGETILTAGQTATIVTANNGISSVLNGNMTAQGGGGGQGGIGGPLGTFGGEGETGGNGGGPLGGAPGAGGAVDGHDVDDDGIEETFNDQGGWGGEGGAGESIVEHKDGIFEGIVTIQVG